MDSQRLIDYINKEALKRNLTISEFAREIHFTENHLGNIMRGTTPGLDVCLRLARELKLKPDYVLYLAGHITEDELDSPDQVPAELLPVLHDIGRMRGTPFFTAALDIVERSLDAVIKLFKEAA